MPRRAEAGNGMPVQTLTTNSACPMLVPCGPLAGRQSVPVGLAVVLVGSRQSANLRINSKRISRAHALIVQSAGRVFLRDLNSRTGTTIDGQPIREVELHGGEVIGIGPFEFEFLSGGPLAPAGEVRELPA